MQKPTLLVTGANGFLGSNLVRYLHSLDTCHIVAACRDRWKLPADLKIEARIGDLTDPVYRRELVQGVDIICHTGTWSSFWGHHAQEDALFFKPCIDLIERAIDAKVQRFLLASTVATAKVRRDGAPIDDFAKTAHTGFWPHLDRLVDVDNYMKANCTRGMQMVTMRLGHFIGRGNTIGLIAALVPRLRTYMVPWLAGGRSRMPLIADSDLAQGFAKAALSTHLNDYESFNICGAHYPSVKEVFAYIAQKSSSPIPFYSVPFFAGYSFGWLMEKLLPVLPGSSPFLTRSLVHVAEDWFCPNDYAQRKLGYTPKKDWQIAVDESLEDLQEKGYPWPRLAQKC